MQKDGANLLFKIAKGGGGGVNFWKRKLFKVLFGLVVIFALCFFCDTNKVLSILSSLSLKSVVILVFMYSLSQILSALKWGILLREGSINIASYRVVSAYFIAMFVNMLGVGTIGGDLFRALSVVDKGESKVQSLMSVVADRGHGFLVLIVVGLFGLFLSGESLVNLELSYISGIFAFLVVLVIFRLHCIVRFVIPDFSFLKHIKDVILLAYPKKAKSIFCMSLFSILAHLLQVSMHLVIATELGSGAPFVVFLAAVPLINAVSCFPITYGGLGIREFAYTYFFYPAFFSKEMAIAYGAIWFLTVFLTSLIGGIFMLKKGIKS